MHALLRRNRSVRKICLIAASVRECSVAVRVIEYIGLPQIESWLKGENLAPRVHARSCFRRWHLHARAVALGAALLAGVPVCPAAPARTETLASQLSGRERKQAEMLRVFSPTALEGIAAAVSAEELERRTARIYELGLFPGTRPPGKRGPSRLHDHLLAEIDRLAPHGLEIVGSLQGTAMVPVTLDRATTVSRHEPASLEVGGLRVPLHPLWPNGAMPSLAPASGMAGPLVYAGRADWPELDGLPLDGAIAVMDFGGGRNYERLFSLGVVAVVVVPDELVINSKAEELFSHTPYPFPRYYVEAEAAPGLLAHCWRRDPAGTAAVLPGTNARLAGGNVYEERPIESWFVHLPPTAPAEITIGESTLLELIAADFRLSWRDLARANELASPTVRAGDRLEVPGRGDYIVSPGELLERLLRLHDVTEPALRAANPNLPAELAPGTTLILPNHDTPLTLVVPIDAISVAPTVPHGAKAAVNLAAALAMLEHLATSPELRRRRGLLVAFTDGDTLGGLASRELAEQVLLHRGRLTPHTPAVRSADHARYDSALGWFESGAAPEGPAGRWLADEWLHAQFERQRIALAEARIPLINALVRARDPESRATLEARRGALEEQLAFLVDVQRNSLQARRLPAADRLDLLRQLLEDPANAVRLAAWGLDHPSLAARYRHELEEEEALERRQQNNLAAASRVLGLVNPRWRRGEDTLRLGWYFDLSDATEVTTIPVDESAQWTMRRANLAVRAARPIASRIRSMLALAALRAGWPEPVLFASAEADRVDYPILPSFTPPTYDEFWMAASIALLPLGAANDRHEKLDTPRDTLAELNLTNLARQARNVLTIVALGLENPLDSTVEQGLNRRDFGRLAGRTVEFNLRSGIDANQPVAGTTVFLPSVQNYTTYDSSNPLAYRGTRRAVIVRSHLNGTYRMPIEDVDLSPVSKVFAYRLDPDRATFHKVANEGRVGTRAQHETFRFQRGSTVEKNIVLTDVTPLVIFPGTDPFEYRAISGEKLGPGRHETEQYIRLIDAVLDGEPRGFAVDHPLPDFRETATEGAVLYAAPGRSIRAISQEGLSYRMLLTGSLLPSGKPSGYRFGPAEGEADGRGLHLSMTPLHIASDMLALAENRLGLYRSFGVTAPDLDEALLLARAKVAEAHTAREERRWQSAIGAAREAWGMLVKGYPRILTLGREAVFSVMVLMAVLVPAAWFLERLLVCSRGIVKRLVGAGSFFVAGTLFLAWFHPAFRIAVSPFIVVIAFVMILMSAVVLVLCYQRFDVLLRRWRATGGEIEDEEISLVDSIVTAFALGVGNLRKRAARTLLTSITVTVLTFSIIAFVAVRSHDSVIRRPIPLDTFVAGEQVDPEPPAYEGVLFREFMWNEMPPATVSAIRTEFGAEHLTTVRAHFIQTAGGHSADKEGINQIPLQRDSHTHVATGIMCFEPAERRFSGLDRALLAGSWFRDTQEAGGDADRFHLILPAAAATALGITPAMIIDSAGSRRPDEELPRVRMMNQHWRVIGILDSGHANRIRDVNGKSLAMIDYLRSGFAKNVFGRLEDETESYHMDWDDLVLTPLAAAPYVNAVPRSIAIRLQDDTDNTAFFRRLAARLNLPLFAHTDGAVSLIVLREQLNIAGLSKIILPIVLCVLIVMNTMLGAVEERRGEVGMLGAIGLSPGQISLLLLSEATVFSILGIVFGTFGGLLFANVVAWSNAAGFDMLSSLSFNFTSLIAMLLALGTGLIVLLATLLPARRAAALAAPSGMQEWVLPPPQPDGRIGFTLPFTVTQGNAPGMTEFFRQFLLNHSDLTSQDFNARPPVLERCADGTLVLNSQLWLAPYDLDVAQDFALRFAPTGENGIYEVSLELARLSGSEESWLRTNHLFLHLVRRQFLLWRNLTPEVRSRYGAQGETALRAKLTAPLHRGDSRGGEENHQPGSTTDRAAASS